MSGLRVWKRLLIWPLWALSAALLTLAQAGPSLVREPNESLRLPQTPQTFGFTTTRAFGPLTFTDPVAVVNAPGETNRLFVVEQAGIVAAIAHLEAPTRSVFLDLRARVTSGGERGLLGLAFHPGFATNRQFFVFYTPTLAGPAGTGLYNRLSRFTAMDGLQTADPASELVLISQFDEASNHNGGDLTFGPDGFLYVALGDEGGANDSYNNSQRIDKDFFAGILRLDVDGRSGSLLPHPHAANTNAQGAAAYWVPADNPFVGATSFNGLAVVANRVRTEFWAVGLRNPWRMSFDRETGLLYAGDVGQNRWEEVNVIQRGGNYGWSYREGNAPGPRPNPPASAQLLAPMVAYGHGSGTNQGFSVTGGVVYRGERFPALYGAYLFADYVSGHVWATRYTGTNNPPFWRLTWDSGVAGFGVDPRNGDILLADQDQDTIKRLGFNTTPVGDPLPATLADTGAFEDLATLRPAKGVVPYDINVPFWSDGAEKQRWFSLADTNQVFGFEAGGNWSLPLGAVWVKHFELELTDGDPASRRRLETRFIVRNTVGMYGVTYRWDDTQTNATLVPEEGLNEAFVVRRNGELREQVWRYPSRGECVACHTPQGGFALSFNTAQLNRDYSYAGGTANQLMALAEAGYLDRPPPETTTLPALVGLAHGQASITRRVRSYLAVNCAPCHQPSAGSLGFWDARFSEFADLAKLIGVPLSDPGGESNNRTITPGSVEFSEILRRLGFRGPGQMPPLASTEVDQPAVAFLSDWVTNTLQGYQAPAESYASWARAHFPDPQGLLAQPDADPDRDGLRNFGEYLYDREPTDPQSHWRLNIAPGATGVVIRFPRLVNRGGDIGVERARALEGIWQPVDVSRGLIFDANGGDTVLSEDALSAVEGFWRARVLDP